MGRFTAEQRLTVDQWSHVEEYLQEQLRAGKSKRAASDQHNTKHTVHGQVACDNITGALQRCWRRAKRTRTGFLAGRRSRHWLKAVHIRPLASSALYIVRV